ncbi:MAG: hypothetical protein M3404_05215 [Actinomycetota bacterium]|nr:hypothetical protein [Actinomycetota bacterium]
MATRRLKGRTIAVITITSILISVLVWTTVGSATPPTFNVTDMQNSMARGRVPNAFKAETDGLVEIKTKGPVDFFTVRLRLRPGHDSGWHFHHGPVLSIVEQGTVTHYGRDCRPQTYSGQRQGPTSMGDGFVDHGQTHILRNEGTTDVVLALTTIIPQGQSPFDPSPPAPASCQLPPLQPQP